MHKTLLIPREGVITAFLVAACLAAPSLAEVTALSYIQDGLISHWDGIENAGYGLHDGTTNVWTDLKGFCDLEIVDADSSWTADAFLPPQKGYATAAKDNGAAAVAIDLLDYRIVETVNGIVSPPPPKKDEKGGKK